MLQQYFKVGNELKRLNNQDTLSLQYNAISPCSTLSFEGWESVYVSYFPRKGAAAFTLVMYPDLGERSFQKYSDNSISRLYRNKREKKQ